jgi:hypothetical protein
MTGVGSLFVYIGSGQQPGYSNTAVGKILTRDLAAATEKKKRIVFSSAESLFPGMRSLWKTGHREEPRCHANDGGRRIDS